MRNQAHAYEAARFEVFRTPREAAGARHAAGGDGGRTEAGGSHAEANGSHADADGSGADNGHPGPLPPVLFPVGYCDELRGFVSRQADETLDALARPRVVRAAGCRSVTCIPHPACFETPHKLGPCQGTAMPSWDRVD